VAFNGSVEQTKAINQTNEKDFLETRSITATIKKDAQNITFDK